jgi:hypothetical protein
MKRSFIIYLTKVALLGALIAGCSEMSAQDKSEFWSRVRFGGGIGASFGNGYTDVTLAPGAIYQFNDYVAAGVSLQGSYIQQKNFYDSWIYGGSIVTLFNPIPEIQLSAEVEQLRVNLTYDTQYAEDFNLQPERDFWNTALFLGAGYNTGNVVIGVRYNVLFNENDYVYSDAFMPFIRVYF